MPRRGPIAIAVAVALGLLGASGCGNDDHSVNPPPGIPATPAMPFTGTFLNGFEAGLLNVTIDGGTLAPSLRAAARTDTLVTATGVLSPVGGGVVSVNGTYDTATDSLKLTGQGYSFLAQYYADASPRLLDGQYTGPNGSGSFVALPGSVGAVKVFCGAFQSNTTATAGRWNIVIAGATLLGLESPNGDPGVVAFSGPVAGTGIQRTLSFTTGTEFVLSGDGVWNTSSNQVSGNWSAADDSGTWEGDLCLPGTAE